MAHSITLLADFHLFWDQHNRTAVIQSRPTWNNRLRAPSDPLIGGWTELVPVYPPLTRNQYKGSPHWILFACSRWNNQAPNSQPGVFGRDEGGGACLANHNWSINIHLWLISFLNIRLTSQCSGLNQTAAYPSSSAGVPVWAAANTTETSPSSVLLCTSTSAI